MSVSLCVIRFAIDDDSPLPTSLLYSRVISLKMAESPPPLTSSPPPALMTPKHDALKDKPSVAWEKVDDGRGHSAVNLEEDMDATIKRNVGCRKESEIHIETYTVEEKYEDLPEDAERKRSYASALASGRPKEKSSVKSSGEGTQSDSQTSAKTTDSDKETVSEITSSDLTDEDSCSTDKSKTMGASEVREHKRHSSGKKEKEKSSDKNSRSLASPSEEVDQLVSANSPQTESSSSSSAASEGRSSKSPLTSIRRRIPFFSGNPVVEITKGIIHLFKENHMTSLDEGVLRSDMICALSVPASLTCHDLLQFFAPLAEGIEHVRIIRDSNPNQYMALIKFKNQSNADDFYQEYNGKPYNSFEDFVCYLVFVSRVECMKSSGGASLATPGITELPTCNICLERMDDSVDGILTILCNHTFHGSCLTKWGDTSCPVCRYCQTPEPSGDNKCFRCGAQESLWICLICGHIGCGRYVEAHAYRHFEDTQHTYAMQLGKQRVWDYAGDNYVHRLVQSKGDGKPVEWERSDEYQAHEEKLDALTLEYTYLLNSQLESQRLYFEEKMKRIEEDALSQVSEVEVRSRKMIEERDRMERELQKTAKEKQLFEKKCAFLSEKMGKVLGQLSEETEMNKCLRDNQTVWQVKVGDLEKKLQEDGQQKTAEINDLKEQLRDVMFFLEAQDTLKKTPERTRQEIQDGQITIGASPTPDGRPSRRGRKKGK